MLVLKPAHGCIPGRNDMKSAKGILEKLDTLENESVASCVTSMFF